MMLDGPIGASHGKAAPMVAFQSATKRFPAGRRRPPFTAVEAIDLEITRGEFVAVVGPSGCGKSTLLNMAAGLMSPSSGVVSYDSKPVTSINRAVGYMTQADNLLPWRTVERNVALGLELRNVRAGERKERVDRQLRLVGLDGFADHYPSQLSGGMRKRAALARTLIYQPETLLMDEPFGALDAQMRLVLQQELLRIWEAERPTVIFITHDIEEAIALSDRVVVMGTDPGRIIHIEPIRLARPRKISELRTQESYTTTWGRIWSLIEKTLTTNQSDRQRATAS